MQGKQKVGRKAEVYTPALSTQLSVVVSIQHFIIRTSYLNVGWYDLFLYVLLQSAVSHRNVFQSKRPVAKLRADYIREERCNQEHAIRYFQVGH